LLITAALIKCYPTYSPCEQPLSRSRFMQHCKHLQLSAQTL